MRNKIVPNLSGRRASRRLIKASVGLLSQNIVDMTSMVTSTSLIGGSLDTKRSIADMSDTAVVLWKMHDNFSMDEMKRACRTPQSEFEETKMFPAMISASDIPWRRK